MPKAPSVISISDSSDDDGEAAPLREPGPLPRSRHAHPSFTASSRTENVLRREQHVTAAGPHCSPSKPLQNPATAQPMEAVISKAPMGGPQIPIAASPRSAPPAIVASQRGANGGALGQEHTAPRPKREDLDRKRTPPRASSFPSGAASGRPGSAKKANDKAVDGIGDSIVAKEGSRLVDTRAGTTKGVNGTGDSIEAKEASRPVEASRLGGASTRHSPAGKPADNTSDMPAIISTPKNPVKSAPGFGTPSTPTAPGAMSAVAIETRLRAMIPQIRQDHSALVTYCIENSFLDLRESQRHVSTTDHFLDMKATEVDVGIKDHFSMKVKLKQHGREHGKGKADNRLCRYRVVCIKTDKKAVPPYRFHHVDIQKNILTPNAMLKFIPHLRDMEASEEKIFQLWVHELQEMDQKSGFNTLKQHDRVNKIKRDELAATVFLYLDQWLGELNIGCTREMLIEYLTSIEDAESEPTFPKTTDASIPFLFTAGFGRAFKGELSLRDVLKLDENWEPMLEKARTADQQADAQNQPQQESLIKAVEDCLTSYTSLGCLICFNHSCEHGEYLHDNHRRAYSVEQLGGLEIMLKKRRIEAKRKQPRQPASPRHKKQSPIPPHCPNKCYTVFNTGNAFHTTREWKDSERMLLKTMFLVFGEGSEIRPQCVAAVLLNRFCFETHKEICRLRLELPKQLKMVEKLEQPKPVKPLSWYDRNRKVLQGDWKDHPRAYEAPRFESHDPCIHDGPCTAANGCGCAKLGVFCERFCRCDADTCALKFTGCACHGSGKTCLENHRQGTKPCICIMLNRECDPVLCQGCGVRERADPENRFNDALHATGCQNCALQRAVSKPVCLGESQLDGCGYGLFTAVDIAEGEFILEYVGELIEHDEGVRREARRGNVFDESENVSYLFTLLEDDGIWVDAAVYGNLSRYMNHAEQGKRSCNVVPKIVYVNGEFRIRFTAQRDIKAGEELFFNYGENFPNLTKKRLEDKAEDTNGGEVLDMMGDDGDEDEFMVAPARASKKARSSKKNGPKPKGKRGGARPGAGRKPNSAKNLNGGVQQAKTAATQPKQRKKPGPKPREGARKEAPVSKPQPQPWGREEHENESDRARGHSASLGRDEDAAMEDADDYDEDYPSRQRRNIAVETRAGAITRRTKRKLEPDDEDGEYEEGGGGSDSNNNARTRATRRAAKKARGETGADIQPAAAAAKRQRGTGAAAFSGVTTTGRFVYNGDADDDDADSDEKPAPSSRHAAAAARGSVAVGERGHGGSRAGSVEIDDSVEGSARLDDNADVSGDEDEQEEEDDDVIDRSRRNRRRPARYE